MDTHLQADHVSGLPALVARTGPTAYMPAGAGVEFDHQPLADGEIVELGNTQLQAVATYVAGALIAGIVADTLGFGGAIAIVAALTAASGLWVLFDMPTRPARTPIAAGGATGQRTQNTV